MKPAFEDTNLQIPAATAEPQDYTGEDGLLYCGKCRTPKEAYFPADKNRPCLGVTATRRSATAGGRSVWSMKPLNNAENTGTRWSS